MKLVADLQIHSKYSRAVSPEMVLENLDKWAKIKGINVLGTGDLTHPLWLKEIKQKLEPAEPGLFKLKKECKVDSFGRLDWNKEDWDPGNGDKGTQDSSTRRQYRHRDGEARSMLT